MYLHKNTPHLTVRALLKSLDLPLSTAMDANLMTEHRIEKLKPIFPPLNNETWEQHDTDLAQATLDVAAKTITLGVRKIRQYALVVHDTVQQLSINPPNVSNDIENAGWLPVPFELNGWIEPSWKYEDETESFNPASLQTVKDEAIRQISDKANSYHRQIIGTEDSDRAKRFETNLHSAKALIAGTATDAQSDMLQLQLDANKFAEHALIKNMTLEQFAAWIAGYEDLSTRASGLIENVLIVGRAEVQKAQSVTEIDTIVNQLVAQADEQFQLLVAGGE